MEEFHSCKLAIQDCYDSQTFSIAHLHKEEATMDMHIHDCYELYYSISGGRQFLINNRLYQIEPGDLFIINQYESHRIAQIDDNVHERIIIDIHPEYLRQISTKETDLNYCFTDRDGTGSNRLHLDTAQQNKFMYFVKKMVNASGFGHDITEYITFTELMIMINYEWISQSKQMKMQNDDSNYNKFQFNEQVCKILEYINNHINETITLEYLSKEFYLSESYLCRIFKATTGTTINKYVIARRINISKALLNEGLSVNEVFEKSGFSDYSSFFKSFTKYVGVSPKKYASLSHS